MDERSVPEAGTPASGAGSILSLIASGNAQSRSSLQEATGLSRATVAQRLNALIAAGFVDESAETTPSGGRPTRVLRLDTRFSIVLVADIGESRIRLAATDLRPEIVAETTGDISVSEGPVAVLTWIVEQFEGLLSRVGRPIGDVMGVGLCLPAPVDFGAGRVVGPSIMTGWDDFDIRGWLRAHFDAQVFAENDVNLMTLSEFRRFLPDVDQMLFVKAGTGIGSGIIADRRIYRGAQGAAGDIGHIQLGGADAPLCRCGKLGCVEARAAGWAIARDLRSAGFEARDARDVLALVRANKPEAIQFVRAAGRILGEVTADVVSVLNPSVIVFGGTLAGAQEHLMSGIRELVYQRSLPLATRELRILTARSGPEAGLLGAAQLVIEAQLSPSAVEQTILRHQATATRRGSRAPQVSDAG